MKDETVIVLCSLICLVIALALCLHYGHDHVIVAAITTAIALPLGYYFRMRREPSN